MEMVSDRMAVKHSLYRTHLATVIGSLLGAVVLAWKHFRSAFRRKRILPIEDPSYFKQADGVVTTLYPYESIPVPDHGRYRLHNEIDDCIVCDLCAKICPVNCITIDPIKSTEEIGKTSDGSTKRIYAATFNIDMAQCCYCGLCTTVCPTECLTMTKAYDYSEFDVKSMVYHFADLSPAEAAEKRKQWDDAQAAKQAAKATPTSAEEGKEKTAAPKPFMPKVAPPKVSIPSKPAVESSGKEEEPKAAPTPKVAVPKTGVPPKVIIPPQPSKEVPASNEEKKSEEKTEPPKVAIPKAVPPKVVIPPPVKKTEEAPKPETPKAEETPKPRPVPPKIKIPVPKKKEDPEKGEPDV